MKESKWVQILKILLMALAALGYTWPLLSGSGHVIVVIAALVAGVAAWGGARAKLRLPWCIAISAVAIGIGLFGSYLALDVIGASSLPGTILQSRFCYYTGLVFGAVFLTRSLALRYRAADIVESALLVGSLVYIFFAHRDFNLQNPREFADYLYTHNYDPITVYRWMGVGAGFLALLLLFGRPHPGRALYSLVFLVILALLTSSLLEDTRLPINLEDPLGLFSNDEDKNNGKDGDDNEDNSQGDKDGQGGGQGDKDNDGQGGGKGDKDGQGGGKDGKDGKGGGGNGDSNMPSPNPDPTPVAIAVFYDEFDPNDGVFHFRQSVLSGYDGNHLVASDFDDDVISTLPVSGTITSTQVQDPTLHTKISTSMFLLKDHQQPPQVGMGEKVFTIQNPDPKLFVSAYGVESYGLTMDLVRLIGHHSIPAEWSSQKVEHYLQIPDDPRYRALSDIIVRKVDPRFYGDDIVKALYIKSWLEKNVYYTLKTNHIDESDPVASFLFGSLRGYCVHIAHSAVYLLRSQGIAARVALGYAVDNRLRDTGSAVLILGSQAHAWPEIYVDGVGWVTFEIFPENGDEPPQEFVDRDLESLFGELARNDKSGGKADEATDTTVEIPWQTIWKSLLGLLLAALVACYVRKIVILAMARAARTPETIHRAARGSIFVWNMYGHSWRRFPTLEAFARSIGPDTATEKLMDLAAAARLGGTPTQQDAQDAHRYYLESRREAARHTKWWRKILGWLNPIVRI